MAFLSPKWYQFLVCCFAAIGSFTYGYDLGIIAQVVASESFIAKFSPTSKESYVCLLSFFFTTALGLNTPD